MEPKDEIIEFTMNYSGRKVYFSVPFSEIIQKILPELREEERLYWASGSAKRMGIFDYLEEKYGKITTV